MRVWGRPLGELRGTTPVPHTCTQMVPYRPPSLVSLSLSLSLCPSPHRFLSNQVEGVGMAVRRAARHLSVDTHHTLNATLSIPTTLSTPHSRHTPHSRVRQGVGSTIRRAARHHPCTPHLYIDRTIPLSLPLLSRSLSPPPLSLAVSPTPSLSLWNQVEGVGFQGAGFQGAGMRVWGFRVQG